MQGGHPLGHVAHVGRAGHHTEAPGQRPAQHLHALVPGLPQHLVLQQRLVDGLGGGDVQFAAGGDRAGAQAVEEPVAQGGELVHGQRPALEVDLGLLRDDVGDAGLLRHQGQSLPIGHLLAQQTGRDLGDHGGVVGVQAVGRVGGGVGAAARVGGAPAADGLAGGADGVVGVGVAHGVGHQRQVHALEHSAFDQQLLAAAVLLGRGADDLHCHVQLGGRLDECEGCPERGAGDEVVAAAVADAGQGVVLHAQRGHQGSAAQGGAEGGGEIGDAALHGEAGLLQQVGDAVAGAVLLEGDLGVRVDGAGDVEHLGPAGTVGIGDPRLRGVGMDRIGGVGSNRGGGGVVGGHRSILPRPHAPVRGCPALVRPPGVQTSSWLPGPQPCRISGGFREVPSPARYRRAGRPPVSRARVPSSSTKPGVRVALRWKFPASRLTPHTSS